MLPLTSESAKLQQKLSVFAKPVNCRVVVVDAQTFLIPNFTYDGQAPDAHFWVGEGNRPGPEVSS